MVGVAVNVTVPPAQIVFPGASETILTLAGKLGFTVTGIELLVAGLPVAQVAFEVIITVTGWPLVRVVVVNVGLFVPALVPLTFH